jgi:uncharacterized membrane protein
VIRTFFEWLGNTGWSTRLLESFWVWPLIESTHVIAIALFAGTTIMMDLRLLGVSFGSLRASDFTARMLPWTRAGFAILVVTGLLLFYSSPVRYYHNVFFRFKMIVFALAGLNVLLFHSRTHKWIDAWDEDPRPPIAAKVAGAISIVAWIAVVISGRMIAYNWFDCDIQPQPDWVNWAAGCVLEAAE